MSKHTPGPWIVTGPHDVPWVSTCDHRTILPQTMADARLIAAAPDLLEALKDAVEIIEGTGLDAGVQRAAIVKATGGGQSMSDKARFNHAFSFGFSLENNSPEGEVTAQELRHAILCRLDYLTDSEILENCGSPWDTYENEED